MSQPNLQRKTPLRRSAPKRKQPMADFWRAVTKNGTKRCALAAFQPTSVITTSTCWGPLDAHHFIPKQRLPDSAKTDPRNGVCLCRHHHNQVTAHRLPCPRPPLLDDFLADHHLLESGRPDPAYRRLTGERV